MTLKISIGDLIRVRDAADEWHTARAASSIEPTHRDGRKIHDFPVVWIDLRGQGIPWPADAVELPERTDTPT